MNDPVGTAERHWGISLRKIGPTEYVSLSGCPFCGDGGKGQRSDRFRVWDEGNGRYWCRQCDASGFLDKLEHMNLSAEERRLRRIEAEQRKAQQEREELARRMTALERIHNCTDHITYNRAMQERHLEYWAAQGIYDPNNWCLGFCMRCPTDHDHRPSYTIPVFRHGQLENIRHRLIGVETDKYRPHLSGLGLQLFNADILDDNPERVCVLEGSKKAMVLTDSGFPSVAMMGKRAFKKSWLPWFKGVKDIVIALDPDAQDSALKLARMFPKKARVATLPAKIDDMVTLYGASADDIESFLRLARPV